MCYMTLSRTCVKKNKFERGDLFYSVITIDLVKRREDDVKWPGK